MNSGPFFFFSVKGQAGRFGKYPSANASYKCFFTIFFYNPQLKIYPLPAWNSFPGK